MCIKEDNIFNFNKNNKSYIHICTNDPGIIDILTAKVILKEIKTKCKTNKLKVINTSFILETPRERFDEYSKFGSHKSY